MSIGYAYSPKRDETPQGTDAYRENATFVTAFICEYKQNLTLIFILRYYRSISLVSNEVQE
jgi:hypothetical protein